MIKILLVLLLMIFISGCDETKTPSKYLEDRSKGDVTYFTKAPRDTSFAYDIEHYGIKKIDAEESLLVSMAPAFKKAQTKDDNDNSSNNSSNSSDDNSDNDNSDDDNSDDDNSDDDNSDDDNSDDDNSDDDNSDDDNSDDDDSDDDDSDDDDSDDDDSDDDDSDDDDSDDDDSDDDDSDDDDSKNGTAGSTKRVFVPTKDFRELGSMSVTLNNKAYSFKIAEDHIGSQVFAPKFTRLGDGSYKVDVIGYSYTENDRGKLKINFSDGLFTMEFIVPSLDTNGDFFISKNILTNAAENDIIGTVVIRPADGLDRVHLTIEVRDFTLYNKDKSHKFQAHFAVDVITSIH